MRRHAVHHTYTRLLSLIAAGLLAFAFAACNGNGGSMDSGGAVYNPNGTASGGSGGSSGSGGTTETFTAQDLLNRSNAGDDSGIVHLVTGGGTSPNSKTVTMSAADLGLPADGTVTLTIIGIGYSATAGVNPDGTVTFEVPLIETGATVTIELTVQDAGGTILWYGSSTQSVDDNIDISLIRQFWTLPASLSVTASPSAIEYDSDNPDSSYTRFSVSIPGLDGAPDGAVFTYSWKDQDGNTVAGATGSSLRLTAGQMLGAGFTPLNASETRTYSVEVTYTEPSGEQAVRTGSAAVTIATEATIVLEGSGVQTDDSGHQFLVLNKSASAAAFTARVLCYGGSVTYGWSTVSGGSATLTGISGAGNSVSPVSGGMTILRVEATLAAGRSLSEDFYVYVLDAVIGGSDVPAVAGAPIIMTDDATDSTNLIASLAGGMSVPGVSYEWQIANTAFATVSTAGNTSAATVQPVATGETTVKLRASYKGVYSDWSTRPLYIAGLTVTQTPSGAAAGDVTMALSDTKYRYASVTHGTGTEIISWDVISGTIGTAPASGTPAGVSGIKLQPSAGGKATVKVSTNVNGRTLSKTFDVYVLDLVVSGTSLSAISTSPTLLTMTDSPSLTASLTGFSDADFTWSVSAASVASCTESGTHHESAAVTLLAADSATVTVSTTYQGLTVSASRYIYVLDLTVTGDEVIEKGDTGTLTASVSGYGTGVSYSWSSTGTAIASVSGTGPTKALTPSAGGTSTVTVTATIPAASKTLSKTITVTVIEPVIKQGGSELAATGNTLSYSSTATLTAELKGLTADSVAWTVSPAGSVTFSDDRAATTTITPAASGDIDITATMTYGGSSYSKTVSCEVQFDVTGLSAYLATLATLSPGDAGHPNVLPALTGLTPSNWTSIKAALQAHSGVYVDLSATTLPETITETRGAFAWCSNLVKPPAFSSSTDPSASISMWEWYAQCANLTTVPEIPEGVTSLQNCFDHGSSGSSLSGPSTITIPSTVTNMWKCFNQCTELGSDPARPVDIIIVGTNVTNWGNAFHNVGANVTVHVPNCAVRKAIKCAEGNDSVTVVVDGTTCAAYTCP